MSVLSSLPRSFAAAGACLLVALAAGCASAGTDSAVKIETTPWGQVNGRPVTLYTLQNARGDRACITDYGATVVQLWLPGRDGTRDDVVLGFDSVQDYVEKSPYFGCIVGRCANRIAKGRFTLDGKDYRLATNNGPNHLHGGEHGFDKAVWEVVGLDRDQDGGPAITLRHVSPDGDEGYPGRVEATVTYRLTNEPALEIDMAATTDAPTIVNLAHHGYWNLGGQASGTILDHELQLDCARYTPTDATLIPTGEVRWVEGTPYDFRRPKPIGQDLAALKAEPHAGHGGGYDVNFVVDDWHRDGDMRHVATLHDPKSGRTMDLFSDQPGVQVYSGNFLDGTLAGKGGAVYPQHGAVCLETQRFPDSIHQPSWPPVVLRPGETYRHQMRCAFSVE